jgi:hypothetical protein
MLKILKILICDEWLPIIKHKEANEQVKCFGL